MDIGNNLKKIRKDKKMTQAEFGKLVGLSVNTIQRYESGDREPSFKIAEKIANSLEVPVTDLLGIEKIGTSDTYVNDEGRVAHVFSKKAFDETDFGTEEISNTKLISAYIGRKANEKNLKYISDWKQIINDIDKIIEANFEREKLLLGSKID
ncbi:helix-turn-helix domain-containing protein [Clostridium sardiniense]|uniref:Helix-turn-helix domain-containing protein n=1 Tax=Clostridium sardiniense TaxID=29369 RepID=A0ABS7L330_CLOSR|nr:helix-turn-helix transcriptional regulator [Clostridium sardiniense]MBY0757450.1 helix-turn-helix domain-containing protein [Clostridium sardiniense]MDQ0462196.1 transcriptional regulator with XRE-family HTH domain [Clostridium sardiniense]